MLQLLDIQGYHLLHLSFPREVSPCPASVSLTMNRIMWILIPATVSRKQATIIISMVPPETIHATFSTGILYMLIQQ